MLHFFPKTSGHLATKSWHSLANGKQADKQMRLKWNTLSWQVFLLRNIKRNTGSVTAKPPRTRLHSCLDINAFVQHTLLLMLQLSFSRLCNTVRFVFQQLCSLHLYRLFSFSHTSKHRINHTDCLFAHCLSCTDQRFAREHICTSTCWGENNKASASSTCVITLALLLSSSSLEPDEKKRRRVRGGEMCGCFAHASERVSFHTVRFRIKTRKRPWLCAANFSPALSFLLDGYLEQRAPMQRQL